MPRIFFASTLKNMAKRIYLKENSEVESLLDKKQGVVFLTGHQANWEIPFLALTEKWKGVAIGKPIKNQKLYRHILSVREMFGGSIIVPKDALRKGAKALKEGAFLGIVGDQAHLASSFQSPFMGLRAWSSQAPALLAYKTGCPLVVGTTVRRKRRYEITGSSPIWPDLQKPAKEEVPRMMRIALSRLETSIQKHPSQWMWIHDRWKQPAHAQVKKKYRYASILVLLPQESAQAATLPSFLQKIYPHAFFTFLIPKGDYTFLDKEKTLAYTKREDLFKRDWSYQLVFDCIDDKSIRRYYQKLGAFETISCPVDEKTEQTLKQTLLKCPTAAIS